MALSEAITRKSFLLLGASAAASASASGPAIPRRRNFSGTWKADMEKSDFASLPKPRSFLRVIDHDDLHLTISVESVDAKGKRQTGELRFGLDGEESLNVLGGAQVVGFARRLGRHILVHTSRVVEGTRFDIDEFWTLSDDGLTLTIEGAVTTGFGDEDLFVVLNREER